MAKMPTSLCGNSKNMQCRYHAWTYDLQGNLKAAPRSDRVPNFSIADYPLLSLKVETPGSWVFGATTSLFLTNWYAFDELITRHKLKKQGKLPEHCSPPG
jgi:hypothetical protein